MFSRGWSVHPGSVIVKLLVGLCVLSQPALSAVTSCFIPDIGKSCPLFSFFNPHPRTCLLILEREEGRKRNISVREKHQSDASWMCLDQGPSHSLGCALRGNEPAALWCMWWRSNPRSCPAEPRVLSFFSVSVQNFVCFMNL